MFNHNNEFSLIELIVVVAVLGILASIVIPNINDMQQKAYVVHVKGNVRDIQTAVDMYRIDHGSYPVGVQPTPSSPQFIDFNLMYPDYLKNLPKYNERYWVDFLGTVWGSHTDIPTMKGQGTSIVSWETIPGVENYAVYEVINKDGQTASTLVGSITGSTGTWHFESLTNYTRRELFEVKAFPESKIIQFIGDSNKQYIVASQDDMGFYTAPGGDELDTPITLEDGQVERTMYVNTAAPSIADWLSISDKKIVPDGSSITYQFAYSNDKGKTLSEWYDNIEDVPDATYLRVKIVLTGTDTAHPILQQLKINYKLQGSEAESCSLNLYQENQDCKMEQSKEPVTSEKVPVDKVIPPKGEIKVPIPVGKPVTSIVPSYSGSTTPDISYSDGENSFDHPSQGNPSDIVIKNPSDKPLTVPDVTINRTDKPPTVQTAKPSEGGTESGGDNGAGGNNGTNGGNGTGTPEKPEVQEAWKELDRFTLIEDAGQQVIWTSVDFTQSKANTDTYRLRVSIQDTNIEDYKSGSNIDKTSQEIKINFIGEVEKSSNLTWKDVPYADTITVYFKEKDGTNKYKEYSISKTSSGTFSKVLKKEGVVVEDFATAKIKQIVSGTYHTLVLTEGGYVYSWGFNRSGQLGDGTTKNSSVPKRIEGLSNVDEIFADSEYNFAMTKDGSLYAWGNNYNYQLGYTGSRNDILEPKKITKSQFSSIKQLGVGSSFTLILTEEGAVYAWGLNHTSQLGYKNETPQNYLTPVYIPRKVKNLPKIKQLYVGDDFTFALSETGEFYCWGSNSSKALGLGPEFDGQTIIEEPILVNLPKNIKQLIPSVFHTSLLTEDGKVYTWGNNKYGQLGDGTLVSNSTPKVIETLPKIKEIFSGRVTMAALAENGDVYAWGDNGCGQLTSGDYTNDKISTPMKLDLPFKVKKMAFVSSNVIALTEDNKIYVWGQNTYGEVGNGTTEKEWTPYWVNQPKQND